MDPSKRPWRHCAHCSVLKQDPSHVQIAIRHAGLQLAYNESADTNLGPFNVEARLTSVGGAVLYATGSGKVSFFMLHFLQQPPDQWLVGQHTGLLACTLQVLHFCVATLLRACKVSHYMGALCTSADLT